MDTTTEKKTEMACPFCHGTNLDPDTMEACPDCGKGPDPMNPGEPTTEQRNAMHRAAREAVGTWARKPVDLRAATADGGLVTWSIIHTIEESVGVRIPRYTAEELWGPHWTGHVMRHLDEGREWKDLVWILEHKGEAYLVRTEGYNYARYVVKIQPAKLTMDETIGLMEGPCHLTEAKDNDFYTNPGHPYRAPENDEEGPEHMPDDPDITHAIWSVEPVTMYRIRRVNGDARILMTAEELDLYKEECGDRAIFVDKEGE